MIKVKASNGNVSVNDKVAYPGRGGQVTGTVRKIVKTSRQTYGDGVATSVRVHVQRDTDSGFHHAIIRNVNNLVLIPAGQAAADAWPPALSVIVDGDGDYWHAVPEQPGKYGYLNGRNYLLTRSTIDGHYGIQGEYAA